MNEVVIIIAEVMMITILGILGIRYNIQLAIPIIIIWLLGLFIIYKAKVKS